MTNNIRSKIWNLIRGGSFHGYLRTASGYPLTLTGCMAEYPVSLSVSGKTVQDGTPSPDSPVEIQGVGDRTSNLFDKDNIFNSDAVSTTAAIRYCRIKLVPNTTYTLSTNAPKTTIYSNVQTCLSWFLSGYVSTGASFANNGVYDGKSRQAVSDSDGYISIAFRLSGAEINITEEDIINEKYWFMLTKGKTALSYEPYGYKVPLVMSSSDGEKQTFPIYMDTPLYGNGEISDTVELDISNKTATLTRQYGSVTTDISDIQDWDSIPKLWRGTVIITADTTVQPSSITAKYYADKPDEEVN